MTKTIGRDSDSLLLTPNLPSRIFRGMLTEVVIHPTSLLASTRSTGTLHVIVTTTIMAVIACHPSRKEDEAVAEASAEVDTIVVGSAEVEAAEGAA